MSCESTPKEVRSCKIEGSGGKWRSSAGRRVGGEEVAGTATPAEASLLRAVASKLRAFPAMSERAMDDRPMGGRVARRTANVER
jgi:hypothetical protein